MFVLRCFIIRRKSLFLTRWKGVQIVFNLFGEKPEHPLYDLAEAKRLLAELPQDDPHKALEDIVFWLETIKSVPGFRKLTRLFGEGTTSRWDSSGWAWPLASHVDHGMDATRKRIISDAAEL
ncbi:MAG TPA: hypothetical protein VFW59_01550 [Gallionella sp.]|nr:hypothetical protein [Gallionella sp.]